MMGYDLLVVANFCCLVIWYLLCKYMVVVTGFFTIILGLITGVVVWPDGCGCVNFAYVI